MLKDVKYFIIDMDGTFYLGDNTATCQGGYDWRHTDRLMEVNDSDIDCSSTGSRSWSDYREDGNYSGAAEIGVEFAKNETIDYFDEGWNLLPLKQNFPNSENHLPKPDCLQEMLQ